MKIYIVYDERAMYDEDEAMVYTTAETLAEARDDAEDFAPCVIFEYTIEGKMLTNGKMIERVE